MSDFQEMVSDLIEYREGGKAPGQKVEAVAHMHNYAANGWWRLECVGLADTREEAAAAAKLHLGQASAAIRVAVTTSVHRVPSTQDEARGEQCLTSAKIS